MSSSLLAFEKNIPLLKYSLANQGHQGHFFSFKSIRSLKYKASGNKVN